MTGLKWEKCVWGWENKYKQPDPLHKSKWKFSSILESIIRSLKDLSWPLHNLHMCRDKRTCREEACLKALQQCARTMEMLSCLVFRVFAWRFCGTVYQRLAFFFTEQDNIPETNTLKKMGFGYRFQGTCFTGGENVRGVLEYELEYCVSNVGLSFTLIFFLPHLNWKIVNYGKILIGKAERGSE